MLETQYQQRHSAQTGYRGGLQPENLPAVRADSAVAELKDTNN
ncbi:MULTISPECIES: hypothetical protein [unclassified Microcoleus]